MINSIISPLLFPVPPKHWGQGNLETFEGRRDNVTTRSHETIPVILIEYSGTFKTEDTYTLLYSHGNAEDLGLSIEYLRHVSSRCRCNILGYDYVGYGASTGSPSEEGCYESIEAAYRYSMEILKISPKYLIIFGRSLGSGPSCHLAAIENLKCRAVILQSPLESGARVLTGGSSWLSSVATAVDPFKNYQKAPLIQVPVLIMHGRCDEVVPFSHGKNLYKMFPNPYNNPLWVTGRGHNDMPEDACLERVAEFLDYLRESTG